MKKIISIALVVMMLFAFSACDSQKSNSTNPSDETKKSENNSQIEVSNLRVEYKEDELYLYGTVLKKGSEIEKSNVYIKCEVFNEKGDYINNAQLKTYSTLSKGDSENVSGIIWHNSNKQYSEEILKKWKVEVDSIEEIDAVEAEKQEALGDIISEIEWKITYDEEYNTALAMLEVAKEEYPDSKELRIFEAQVKDMLAEKGIVINEGNTYVEGEEEMTTEDFESSIAE